MFCTGEWRNRHPWYRQYGEKGSMRMRYEHTTHTAQPVCLDSLEPRVFLSADASPPGLLAAAGASPAGTLSMMIGIDTSAGEESVVTGRGESGLAIQPDGPMPQTARPGCGPPVKGESEAADADGDGKLGLNDVKTSAAGEPTSLTFNGRGIDLNEDEKVDVLAGNTNAQAARDGKITPSERRQLATIIAYEPVWAIGAAPWIGGSILSAHAADASEASAGPLDADGNIHLLGADRTISAASYDFGADRTISAASYGFGEADTETDGSVQVPFVQEPGEKAPWSTELKKVETPIVMDILGSTKNFP
jgi:hypothetical protein